MMEVFTVRAQKLFQKITLESVLHVNNEQNDFDLTIIYVDYVCAVVVAVNPKLNKLNVDCNNTATIALTEWPGRSV